LFVFAGEEFRILVDKYLRQGLHKGVPPLFVDLRSLYQDPEKVDVIQRLVLQYVDSLQKVGRFSEEGNLSMCYGY
jgi:peptide alpha-N-acetyltransferase